MSYTPRNLAKIVELYQKAVSAYPKDAELNTRLFNALVRVDSWKLLSAQAVKLKNLAPPKMSVNYVWVCLKFNGLVEYLSLDYPRRG
jgi:hypothetical protein